MNKAELIETVASKLNEPKAAATRSVDAVLEALAEGIREDEKVNLANFGTFKLRHRAERQGINPSTRQPITIPASATVGFTPAKAFKQTLNGNGQAG
ncbi:MAG: DNA-binding protein HU-beta [Phycisphaerales bacterium]